MRVSAVTSGGWLQQLLKLLCSKCGLTHRPDPLTQKVNLSKSQKIEEKWLFPLRSEQIFKVRFKWTFCQLSWEKEIVVAIIWPTDLSHWSTYTKAKLSEISWNLRKRRKVIHSRKTLIHTDFFYFQVWTNFEARFKWNC